MHVYILTAIDGDYRVRECVAVTDLKTARDLYADLRETWGGRYVCMASRVVDDIPDNLMGALGVTEVEVSRCPRCGVPRREGEMRICCM